MGSRYPIIAVIGMEVALLVRPASAIHSQEIDRLRTQDIRDIHCSYRAIAGDRKSFVKTLRPKLVVPLFPDDYKIIEKRRKIGYVAVLKEMDDLDAFEIPERGFVSESWKVSAVLSEEDVGRGYFCHGTVDDHDTRNTLQGRPIEILQAGTASDHDARLTTPRALTWQASAWHLASPSRDPLRRDFRCRRRLRQDLRRRFPAGLPHRLPR